MDNETCSLSPNQDGAAATNRPLRVGHVPPLAESAARPYLLDPPETDSQRDHLPPGADLIAHFPHLDDHPDYHERSATDHATDPHTLSVTFRHSGWLRNRGLIAASLYRTEQPSSRRRNFANCGSDTYVLRSTEYPDVYRLAGSACHDRFCLPCAQERSRAIALNVLELTEGRQTRFLTLTLKASSNPLSTQLDKLYASFQALRRRKLWKQKVSGGVAFLEVTWSEAHETWHPHFHILIEGSYLPHQQLKKLWYAITGDSFVVDIRFVRDLRTAAQYVTKYASKPFNNTFLNRAYLLDEILLALKGRKLLLTFGAWRGITLIQTPSEGAWEHVAPLETIITNAANGDQNAELILRNLTDADLRPLYARAPPQPKPEQKHGPQMSQLTFFGAWQADGTYTYPGKHPKTFAPTTDPPFFGEHRPATPDPQRAIPPASL